MLRNKANKAIKQILILLLRCNKANISVTSAMKQKQTSVTSAIKQILVLRCNEANISVTNAIKQ